MVKREIFGILKIVEKTSDERLIDLLGRLHVASNPAEAAILSNDSSSTSNSRHPESPDKSPPGLKGQILLDAAPD
jgi:hypothetical protein